MPALDATMGGAAANSYVTIEEANAYFEAHTHAVAWTDAFPEQQARALIRARRELDLLDWAGLVVTDTQACAWPRAGVRLRSGFYCAHDAIPLDIKDAQCELGMELLRDEETDPLAPDDTANLSSLSAGGVSLTFNSTRAAIGPQRYSGVMARIRPYLANAGQARVIRC